MRDPRPKEAHEQDDPPVIFPVIYAVLVWYFTLRWRRQWPGMLALAAGTGILVLIGLGLNGYEYAVLPPGVRVTGELQRGLRLLSVLLWPYTFLVYMVGQFIFALPRRGPEHRHCLRCDYDLRGHVAASGLCPECGEPWADAPVDDVELLPRPAARTTTPARPATPPQSPAPAAEAPRSIPT